jgi:hypothetical protein
VRVRLLELDCVPSKLHLGNPCTARNVMPRVSQTVSLRPPESATSTSNSALARWQCQIGVAYTAAYLGHRGVPRLGIDGLSDDLNLILAPTAA